VSEDRTLFHKRLVVAGFVMLFGIGFLLAPKLLNLAVPRWWEPVMALFTAAGAFAELHAVWSYSRAIR
jgi:hypothetical protein